MFFDEYRKAIVPIVVGVALIGLAHFGITPQMSVQDVVTTLVTAGLVFLVPNKK